MSERIHITRLVVGSLDVNCYVVRSNANSEAVVIDPGGNADRIIRALESEGLEPKLIVNTHGHADHIAANEALKERWPDARLVIGRNDEAMLTAAEKNLSMLIGLPFTSPAADQLVGEGEVIGVDSVALRVIEIPGHTPGGICLYLEGGDDQEPLLFSGDALFAGSIGRSDIPGGDHHALVRGIKEKLFALPEATRVYPGHGPATTIAEEKATNPFT